MKLKSLEIQGFKSFPDRTKLEFNDGITVVIGPNGSGKSNISDAIRWVLGEQSTRTLRGAKMEDVIFGGTQTRKSGGVCSVTLEIDNKMRIMPFDTDQVLVNRRLYRSGESEYRVNSTMVRLKDIHEMFMDTGLGRDGYSIIGQGRVSEIVSAKNKERREIFEEAVGISKFRYRKSEAQRRLMLAEENILRLKDIINELESRVEPLKREAKKAKSFISLSEEKKEIEISYWVYQLRQSRQKLNNIEDSLILKKQQFDISKLQVEQLETQVENSHKQMQEILTSIDDIQNDVKYYQNQLSQEQSTKAVLENDISHNIKSIEEHQETLFKSEDTNIQMEETLKSIKHQLEDNQKEYDLLSSNLNSVKQKIESENLTIKLLDMDIASEKHAQSKVLHELETAKLSMASSVARLGESKEQLDNFLEQLTTSDYNVDLIVSEIKEMQLLLVEIDLAIKNTANEITAYKLKNTAKQNQINCLIKEKDELLSSSREKRHRAKVLSDMDRNMEGYINSVKFVISQGRSGKLKGIIGAVSSLITVTSQYAVAIEIALGGAMQNIVVEDEESAKAAIRLLTQSKSGRATFLPLTSVNGRNIEISSAQDMDGYIGIACELITYDNKYNKIMANLLGRTIIASDMDSAVGIAKKFSYSFRIVTLDGQIINTSGSMTGGFISRSAGILGRQSEVDKLNNEAFKIEHQIAIIDSKIMKISNEILEVNIVLERLYQEAKTSAEDKIRYESENKRLNISHVQAQIFKENSRIQHQALLDKINQNESFQLNYTSNIKELNQKLEQSIKLLEQKIAKKESINLELITVNDNLNKITTELLLKKRDLEQQNLKYMETSQSFVDKKYYQQQLLDKMNLLLKENVDINEKIKLLAENNCKLTDTVEKSAKTISELMHKRNAVELFISQTRAKQREIENMRDNQYREVVKLEESKIAAQTSCSGFISGLWNEYEITLTQAEEIASPIEESIAISKIAEIKGHIKLLGNINLGAIEEYKEVSERYNFMSSQLNDVQSSKSELIKLIEHLTQQMCRIFEQRFELINKKFQKIFVELFGGGHASLTLTEPEDILGSGIDISVAPPGKIIKNLTALSGGEQAFIAIAIFFAILEVNPSPFCIMDEIEAALDDVNVSKFACYLRNLSQQTQFVVITHRRGTMEQADVIYGVTMQEDGVSKLLQLRVNEIATKYGIK